MPEWGAAADPEAAARAGRDRPRPDLGRADERHGVRDGRPPRRAGVGGRRAAAGGARRRSDRARRREAPPRPRPPGRGDRATARRSSARRCRSTAAATARSTSSTCSAQTRAATSTSCGPCRASRPSRSRSGCSAAGSAAGSALDRVLEPRPQVGREGRAHQDQKPALVRAHEDHLGARQQRLGARAGSEDGRMQVERAALREDVRGIAARELEDDAVGRDIDGSRRPRISASRPPSTSHSSGPSQSTVLPSTVASCSARPGSRRAARRESTPATRRGAQSGRPSRRAPSGS